MSPFAPTLRISAEYIEGTTRARMIVDTLLHGLVEQNPTETPLKFINHNLPKLIKQIREETKEGKL